MIRIVQCIPNTQFYFRKLNTDTDKYEWEIKKSTDIFRNKRILLFSVSGAFTQNYTELISSSYCRH